MEMKYQAFINDHVTKAQVSLIKGPTVNVVHMKVNQIQRINHAHDG
jgi:hypothetical protein